MKLTIDERNTQLWKELKAHLELRRADLLLLNANVNTGKRKTAVLRGRIAEIEELLRLDSEQPVPVFENGE